MTPPTLHTQALTAFDAKVHDTFAQVTGVWPDSQQWQQACRGFAYGGLGLRSATLHKEAAYLSSTAASRELCHSIDPDYRLEASVAGSAFSDALQAFNAKLPADMRITVDSVAGASQKALSAMLDNAGHESRLQALCPSDQATLISECQDGAKDFWTAIPSKALGTAVPAAEFTVEIQYRLCMSQGSNVEASFCPLCDAVMDDRGHHCRQCSAGGDRTVRHNRVRNEVHAFCCNKAGIHAELEKANLLLPARPHAISSHRRPADVYLPLWHGGRPAALDFAVTSPNQDLFVARSSNEALSAAKAYSEIKRCHQNTAQECEQHGVSFIPMVAETSGAWSPEATLVFKHLAKKAASHVGGEAREVQRIYRALLQKLAVVIRTANARAHLKRMGT